MTRTITADLVEAYSLCPRKASLLMAGEPNPGSHPYVRIIGEQATGNREIHRASLEKAGDLSRGRGSADLSTGPKVAAETELTLDDLHAHCEFLTRVNETSRLGRFSYEPVKVIGTRRASRSDIVALTYQGLVLGQAQGQQPCSGTLILLGDRPDKVKLAGKYKEVRRIIDALRIWEDDSTSDVPPIVLNKHCPSCPFRDVCLRQAEKEDNLSLLDRMTPKLMRRYHDKGIFTVKQLSHLFKPRRSKKKAKRQVRHSLELQALAIRTGKIHVEHLPELPRRPVELFLDFEGIPDRDFYYLTGLLVCRGGQAEYESFWADDGTGEAAMWSAVIERLAAFPDSPIYHYGSYEKKAFATLANRYSGGGGLSDRLVNVASSVYGKVYFPVLSNGLKSLGRFLGAKWTDPQASGLQSLVWRHSWEASRDEQDKQSLIRYNREDCEAVRMLVEHLAKIGQDAELNPAIDFADRPKQSATDLGREAHLQFERILRAAEEDGRRKSVRVRQGGVETEGKPKKRGAPEGHQGYLRIVPSKVNRKIRVPPRRRCPKGHGDLTHDERVMAARTVTDLVFNRSGCRKTITRYEGKRGFCQRCKRHYDPPAITRLGNRTFGHAFQAWAVYQRIVLRLPYRIIAQVTEHLFGVGMSATTGINFLRYLAEYYAPTEAASLKAILQSDFVHVDETRINIEGVDHYV